MKKSNVWKKTEWAGLICIFFILMILIRMLWNSGSDGEMADIRSVNSGWYQMVDGKEKALELPAMVKADQDVNKRPSGTAGSVDGKKVSVPV